MNDCTSSELEGVEEEVLHWSGMHNFYFQSLYFCYYDLLIIIGPVATGFAGPVPPSLELMVFGY